MTIESLVTSSKVCVKIEEINKEENQFCLDFIKKNGEFLDFMKVFKKVSAEFGI